MLRALIDNRLNLLLIVAPVSWALYLMTPGSPWIFITAAVSASSASAPNSSRGDRVRRGAAS